MDLRRIVLDNPGIKLLSLGLSLVLWLYVMSTGKTELTLTVPVELRNVPPGMTVVGDVTGSVEVRMQGQERVLRDGTISKKVVAVLDLSGAKEGENRLRLSPDDIRRPSGIIIMHVAQPEIRVSLERLMRRVFTVRPVLHGAPAAGYRLRGTNVKPPRVTIEGPASVVKILNRIETMPIDIKKAKESVTVEPRIDYRGKPVKLIDKNITVTVSIERTGK
jgi:hypothetical protein